MCLCNMRLHNVLHNVLVHRFCAIFLCNICMHNNLMCSICMYIFMYMLMYNIRMYMFPNYLFV